MNQIVYFWTIHRTLETPSTNSPVFQAARFRLFFILVSIVHLVTVYIKANLYGYIPSPDSYRYLHVAGEFTGDLATSAAYNCNTAPGYPLFLALLRLIHASTITGVGLAQSLLFCLSLYHLTISLLRSGHFGVGHATLASAVVLFTPDIISTNGTLLSDRKSTRLNSSH